MRSISGSLAAAVSSVSCNRESLFFSSSTAPETTLSVVDSLATSRSCLLALLGARSQPRTARRLKEKCERGLRAIEGFNPVRSTIMSGCILLQAPFFFPENEWIPASDWAPNIVQGRSYDTGDGAGLWIWQQVEDRLKILRTRGSSSCPNHSRRAPIRLAADCFTSSRTGFFPRAGH